jgi:hypothetical protein
MRSRMMHAFFHTHLTYLGVLLLDLHLVGIYWYCTVPHWRYITRVPSSFIVTYLSVFSSLPETLPVYNL